MWPTEWDCGPTDLPDTFRNVIGDGKELVSLLIKQKMIVPEMQPAHMPMKVLRL
jgi:hypothetical protein